ncbi:hypothetical protein FACS1894145_3250 [Bacteroidia bacterium]|nr:hypothetical protein FACS189446_8900 [Bacteroidia bacterium]GHU79334.1 hypothetical protein FACS1894145_3250 [Bacteroidia bacterium]
MQRKWVLLVLLLSFAQMNFSTYAQDDKKKAEFEAFKMKRIAFITKVMKLTDSEAKAFWPVCNELQEKKFILNQQVRKKQRAFAREESAGKKHSQEEYLALVKLVLDAKVQEAGLDSEYMEKFAKVIPAEKIYLYQEAERQFAREVLEGQRDNHPR